MLPDICPSATEWVNMTPVLNVLGSIHTVRRWCFGKQPFPGTHRPATLILDASASRKERIKPLFVLYQVLSILLWCQKWNKASFLRGVACLETSCLQWRTLFKMIPIGTEGSIPHPDRWISTNHTNYLPISFSFILTLILASSPDSPALGDHRIRISHLILSLDD